MNALKRNWWALLLAAAAVVAFYISAGLVSALCVLLLIVIVPPYIKYTNRKKDDVYKEIKLERGDSIESIYFSRGTLQFPLVAKIIRENGDLLFLDIKMDLDNRYWVDYERPLTHEEFASHIRQ